MPAVMVIVESKKNSSGAPTANSTSVRIITFDPLSSSPRRVSLNSQVSDGTSMTRPMTTPPAPPSAWRRSRGASSTVRSGGSR